MRWGSEQGGGEWSLEDRSPNHCSGTSRGTAGPAVQTPGLVGQMDPGSLRQHNDGIVHRPSGRHPLHDTHGSHPGSVCAGPGPGDHDHEHGTFPTVSIAQPTPGPRADQVVNTEWTLNRQVVAQLWKVWGMQQIDLMTTELTHQLSIFRSLYPDPGHMQSTRCPATGVGWTAICFPCGP